MCCVALVRGVLCCVAWCAACKWCSVSCDSDLRVRTCSRSRVARARELVRECGCKCLVFTVCVVCVCVCTFSVQVCLCANVCTHSAISSLRSTMSFLFFRPARPLGLGLGVDEKYKNTKSSLTVVFCYLLLSTLHPIS